MKVRNCFYYIVSCIIIMLTSLNAQLVTQHAIETTDSLQSYPIIGSHLLKEEEQAVKIYIEQHPEMFSDMKMAKPTAWSFKVDDPYDWYAVDFTNSTRYLTKTRCRAVGTNCYIFVEDSMWLTRVNQAAVDSVRTAFDLRTPASNIKGVYQIGTSAFGNPPDVDSDPRIIILILNIRDGFTGTGGYIAGYFSSYNETILPQSNRAEIFFLDANPLNLLTPSGLAVGMSTTAHEFQHMIHWNHDSDELTFINESYSLVSEVLCGYPINDQSGYINETNHYLFDWRTNNNIAVLRDYSRASRFSIYYHDQFGATVFKPMVANTANGIAGINGGLQTYGTSLRFDDLFKTWLIANILDDTTVNSAYGYKYAGLLKATGLTFMNPNVPVTTDTVKHLGSRYLSFKGGTGLNANFTVANASIQIKAVEIGPGGKRVLDVTPGIQFSEPNFGTTYTEVHFVVMNTSTSTPYTYTYQAAGGTTALELKWDTTEPTGYLPLARKDTVCVTFDGVQGGKLDSVRVALRRAGSMTGGVWRYTGNTNPTPLGQPLAVPITASISTTPPYPYPVPWPNWSTVDLRSYNIDASTPFAVGFICEGDSISQPRVMVTEYPSSAPYHSFTYYNEATTPKWYYLSANQSGDTIYIYLIRAYVSFVSSDFRNAIELSPASFSLKQNYPNPFNPTTNFGFRIPAFVGTSAGRSDFGFVSLKVYDVLGREVAIILSEELPAGTYTRQWNAEGITSGVYFYRLEAISKTDPTQRFTEVKKMIVVR